MNKVVFLIPVAASLVCGPAFAGKKPTVDELEAKIQKLEARINELENHKAQASEPADISSMQGASRNYPRRQVMFNDPFDWDPFVEMDRMNRQMQRMFQGPSASPSGSNVFSQSFSFGQNFELKETDQGYVLDVDMKGMDQDKFHLDIKSNSITISGEQSSQQKQDVQGAYFQSSSFGSFVQTIPLPADADTSKIKTEKQDDRLVVIIPKKK